MTMRRAIEELNEELDNIFSLTNKITNFVIQVSNTTLENQRRILFLEKKLEQLSKELKNK